MALRDMGADFEYYRISEWEVNANRSYKAIHNPNDNMDYSKKFEKFKWLARALYEYGISVDGKTQFPALPWVQSLISLIAGARNVKNKHLSMRGRDY